nr:hypothetical protein [Tanacetum cinerariifolium]
MNQNDFEPNPNYSGFDQPPQYSIDHQEDLNQQRISDVHNRWNAIEESQKEILNMVQSFCEMVIQQKQATNIDQSPPQEMCIQDMEDLKHYYLNEMLSLSKFNGMSIEINKKKELQHLEQVANLSTYPSQCFKSFCYDDDDYYDYEESNIPLNKIISQEPPFNAITPVLPTTEDLEDSIIMRNEELSNIPKKESDEFIKSSVENLVPIPSKSEDTSESDSECNLLSYEDFSLINVSEEKSMTFSNHLFDSNDDFTFSDDKSLSDEDVPKDNVKFTRTLFSNSMMKNDDLFDLESKKNEWKKILYDASINDLMFEDKFFDPGGDIDEINAFLDIDIFMDIKDGYYDLEGDVLFLENLLSDDTTLKPSLEDCPDFEDSCARGFVHRPLELLSFACLYIWESDILYLID